MAKLAIDQIEATAGTQVRVKIDQTIVKEYAEAIEAGAIFPPLVVFVPKNSSRYILADGFHRLAALKSLERKTVGVDVKEGELHDAVHYALSANTEHGLRRTSADKSHAVQMALKDPHYDEWSLREVADLCRVSHELVRVVKTKNNEPEQKKATPRKRKAPPTQDQTDAKELRGALATITGFPYAGDDAYGRLQLVSEIDNVKLVYDWLGEAIDEHIAQEDGPDA